MSGQPVDTFVISGLLESIMWEIILMRSSMGRDSRRDFWWGVGGAEWQKVGLWKL